MTYTVYFKRKTYNQHKRYHNNQNKYIGSRFAINIEQVREIIAEIEAKGHTITNIYNSIGQKVSL